MHAWHVASGGDMRMSGYAAKVRSLDWIAKPPLLLTSGSSGLIAWPFAGRGPQGKRPVETAVNVGELVTRVAAHPSRPLAAIGFDDGQVAICMLTDDLRTVRLRRADGQAVTCLSWSSDGSRVAVGTAAGTVTAYDLASAGPS